MNSQFLYLQDPFTLEFDATIRETLSLPGGRVGVILDRSYFYPTGGGQRHDTGHLDDLPVVDVFKNEAGDAVVHIIALPTGRARAPQRKVRIPEGEVRAKIDPGRRTRHMQHHTAQHLLSQCFHDRFALETFSANINGFTPSTIDLPDGDLTPQMLAHAENLANRIIFENRPVKTYFVAPDKIHTVPLRRSPKVAENIRIVEIDSFDYSACGATHCTHTGMIGVLKIVKVERQNQKTRVHFVAGQQSLEYFRTYQDIAQTLAGQMSAHPRDVVEIIQRQTAQLKAAHKELQALQRERTMLEARELAAHADPVGPHRVALMAYKNRPVGELRTLANKLKDINGIIGLLATYDGRKISLVAVCAADTGVAARDLINLQLARVGGRGGGDRQVAQGGGTATPKQFADFFTGTHDLIRKRFVQE